MSKNVLITGGCGFIGHHTVEHFYKNTDYNIIIIDKLSYASNGYEKIRSANLIDNPRVKIFSWDLSSPLSTGLIFELGDVNYILHLAAETHVDNSISDPVMVINNNISSTVNILEYARKLKNLEKFFYFSTDEVYGVAPVGVSYKEDDVHKPSNPYSASKSGSEMIALAYANTYKIPVIITNTVNVIGERQHVEKYVPKVIKTILDGNLLEIHANKDCSSAGSRFYIHARNVADAILFLIKHGTIGEKYNITDYREFDNLQIALMISKIMGKQLNYKLVNFHESRPGHDLRYDLCGDKMKNMGWKPKISFEESLNRTVEWTLRKENMKWLL